MYCSYTFYSRKGAKLAKLIKTINYLLDFFNFSNTISKIAFYYQPKARTRHTPRNYPGMAVTCFGYYNCQLPTTNCYSSVSRIIPLRPTLFFLLVFFFGLTVTLTIVAVAFGGRLKLLESGLTETSISWTEELKSFTSCFSAFMTLDFGAVFRIFFAVILLNFAPLIAFIM